MTDDELRASPACADRARPALAQQAQTQRVMGTIDGVDGRR